MSRAAFMVSGLDQVREHGQTGCMEAVTGATRNAVWQEMLDVARLVRYYDRMARQQQQRHLAIRIVLFASATAGMASAIDALPEVVRIASGALIALLVAWDFLADYANKAAILGVIRGECSEVGDELAELWGRIQSNSANDDDARLALANLKRRVTRVTARAGAANISTNERLNIRCEEDAFKALSDRYAEG